MASKAMDMPHLNLAGTRQRTVRGETAMPDGAMRLAQLEDEHDKAVLHLLQHWSSAGSISSDQPGMAAIEKGDEARLPVQLGEQLAQIVVNQETAVAEIDRHQGFVPAILFIAPIIAEIGAMAGIMQHQQIAAPRIGDEIADALAQPLPGRFLLRHDLRAEADALQRLVPETGVGDAARKGLRRIGIDADAQG